jgi:hypothetical protein
MQTFLEDHDCSKIDKCIHCQQNHKCNSLKFPVVKSFRAELTKKLLNFNHHPAIMMKLNDLIGKISEVKDHLANLALKYDKFEQFMLEKFKMMKVLKKVLMYYPKTLLV